ncbi:MAG TPA: hypothetical protein VHP14_16355 [Anaerolineales bacterium]|nr:hypothetical protein [Anaerolineales bacterium]
MSLHVPQVEVDQRLNQVLSECEKAIREGNRQRAYDFALQATKLAPDHLEAWFLRASLAPSLEERLFCVNCMSELCPDCEDRRNVAFAAVKELLDRDPFLAYLEETEALYRVVNKSNQVVVIPKKRAAVTPFLVEQEQPNQLKPAYRLLLMAVFGLLLAGLGALVFAPLAALAAIGAGLSPQSRAERVGSVIVLMLSGLMFLTGLFFSYLFVLHVIG